MAFTGEEKHEISLDEAKKLIGNKKKAESMDAAVRTPKKKGGFFGKKAIEKLMKQKGCVGIRYYFGEQEDGTPEIILVGVDKNQDDMMEGSVLEMGIPCPPMCGRKNDLNK